MPKYEEVRPFLKMKDAGAYSATLTGLPTHDVADRYLSQNSCYDIPVRVVNKNARCEMGLINVPKQVVDFSGNRLTMDLYIPDVREITGSYVDESTQERMPLKFDSGVELENCVKQMNESLYGVVQIRVPKSVVVKTETGYDVMLPLKDGIMSVGRLKLEKNEVKPVFDSMLSEVTMLQSFYNIEYVTNDKTKASITVDPKAVETALYMQPLLTVDLLLELTSKLSYSSELRELNRKYAFGMLVS